MKILITGNMGYLGPAVIRQLRSSYPGAVLIGYDLGLYGSNLTNVDFLPECRVDLQFFGDVRNFPASILVDIDVVIHLAAISNDSIGVKYKDITMAVNYRASKELAAMAKRTGVKIFVFASSCSVYGVLAGGLKTEQSAVNPLTTYAQSKLLAEKALESLADPDFIVTCLRFATASGMSERLRLDLVLNDFVAGALTERRINVLSDGTPWRAIIDIRDMSRAIDWAIRRKLADGGEYLVVNTGYDQGNYQIKELADIVAKNVPNTAVSVNKEAQMDLRSYQVDFALYRSLAPSFQPQYDVQMTVRGLVEGLNAMGFNDRHFRYSKLIRLEYLEYLKEKQLLTEQLNWLIN